MWFGHVTSMEPSRLSNHEDYKQQKTESKSTEEEMDVTKCGDGKKEKHRRNEDIDSRRKSCKEWLT